MRRSKEFLSKLLAPLRRLKKDFWITFLIAVLISAGGEFAFASALRSLNGDLANSLLALTGFYQRLVTAPHTPMVHYTVLVEINDQRDIPGVSALNVCDERNFLSHLLLRIDAANPAVIVVDKYFGKSTCDSMHSAGTLDLIRTVESIRRKGHLIVTGLRTPELEEPGVSSWQVSNLLPWGEPLLRRYS
jgi:hypothetical protein